MQGFRSKLTTSTFLQNAYHAMFFLGGLSGIGQRRVQGVLCDAYAVRINLVEPDQDSVTTALGSPWST